MSEKATGCVRILLDQTSSGIESAVFVALPQDFRVLERSLLRPGRTWSQRVRVWFPPSSASVLPSLTVCWPVL
uniref:Uncharacterized protein n=1 Tax=Anguilla anguilla TaxID=7936 RepID=A0A0E9WJV9_ANGAN